MRQLIIGPHHERIKRVALVEVGELIDILMRSIFERRFGYELHKISLAQGCFRAGSPDDVLYFSNFRVVLPDYMEYLLIELVLEPFADKSVRNAHEHASVGIVQE